VFSCLDSFPQQPPRVNNEKIKLSEPFSLNDWIDKHREDFQKNSSLSLFDDEYQSRVYILSQGQHQIECSTGDVWLWQHVRFPMRRKKTHKHFFLLLFN